MVARVLGAAAPAPYAGPPSPAAVLADPDFAALKAEIVERTGHFYFADKDALLAERLVRRLQATRLATLSAYRGLLRMAQSGVEEWRSLEAEITVGETFFFRYAEQFAALRDSILPDLIEAARPERRLRIWSAGCANGAEPYSIAVVLADLLGDELAEWRISILGTDLSMPALAAAAEARYGNWTLRAVPPAERLRLFEPAGAEWKLRPRYRRMVHFQRHNLLALGPGTDLALAGFDLILCRNVLIYFHPDTARRTVGELVGRLARGGLLLLGHAELSLDPPQDAARTEAGGVTAFRRSAAVARPPGASRPAAGPATPATPAAWMPLIPPPVPGAAPTPAAPPVKRPPAAPAHSETPSLETIRGLAGAGRLADAADAAAARAAALPLDPTAHFYAGMVADAAGDRAAAEAALRRGLFLDRRFAVAHLFLGIVLAGGGARIEAGRAFANAAAAAAALPPGAEVAEGGGMTAAELVILARSHRAALRRERPA